MSWHARIGCRDCEEDYGSGYCYEWELGGFETEEMARDAAEDKWNEGGAEPIGNPFYVSVWEAVS